MHIFANLFSGRMQIDYRFWNDKNTNTCHDSWSVVYLYLFDLWWFLFLHSCPESEIILVWVGVAWPWSCLVLILICAFGLGLGLGGRCLDFLMHSLPTKRTHIHSTFLSFLCARIEAKISSSFHHAVIPPLFLTRKTMPHGDFSDAASGIFVWKAQIGYETRLDKDKSRQRRGKTRPGKTRPAG